MTSILDSAFKRLADTNEPPSESEVTQVRSLLKELEVRIVDFPGHPFPCATGTRRSPHADLLVHYRGHIRCPARRVRSLGIDPRLSLLEGSGVGVPRVMDISSSSLGDLHPHVAGPLHLLDMALSRSKERPLSISFTPERATPGVKFFYQRLLLEAQRWKCARIYIPNNVYDCFTKLEGGSLPHLETLDLVIDLNTAHKEAPTFFAAFESAPLLHDVTISGTQPLSAGRLPSARLPWKQMRRFCTEHICSIDHLLEILANTPSLRALDLLCLKWHYPKYAEALGVHESVQSLRLWDPRLLDYLVLPAVECVELELDEKDKYAAALGKFVRRSECAPRKLVLRNGRPSERLDALRSVPTLEHLVLDEGFHGRENVEALFRGLTWGAESVLLPRMAHFEWIADISSFQFDGDCLLDMIESRWKVAEDSAVAPLRSVKVACRAWRSKLSPSSLRRLEQLKRDGLDISISFNDNHLDRTWSF
ncbi:hypothetical protein CPB85DRAFT_1430565 [Mucidula mucida]|nr:hypothetical protein CPB85DRAFT_1430565 [Mucidula mucida]